MIDYGYIYIGPNGYITNNGLVDSIFVAIVGGLNSTIINGETGSIETNGNGLAGMLGEANSDVWNLGLITTNGDSAAAMFGEDQASIINFSTGNISVSGIGAVGMEGHGALTGVLAQNEGIVTTVGDESAAIYIAGAGVAYNNNVLDATGNLAVGIEALAPGATDVAQITNSASGTINVSGTGAEGIGVTGTATILNSGSISTDGLDSEAIYVEGNNAGISNSSSGVINTLGNGSVGIDLQGSGTITNDGSVTSTGSDSVGIWQVGDGSIRNTGTVAVDGDDAWAIYGVTGGSESITIANDGSVFAFGLRSGGLGLEGTGSITNGGSVTAEGATSTAIGATGDDIAVTNSSTGIVTVSEVESIGIGITGDRSTLINQGLIEAQSSGSRGIVVFAGDTATINNTGTIKTFGVDGYGIEAVGINLSIVNSNIITTLERQAHGIVLGESISGPSNGWIGNSGAIETQGINAHGILGFVTGTTVTNLQSIHTTQNGSAGIKLVGSNNKVFNGVGGGTSATIRTDGASDSTSGQDSIGISLTGDQSEIRNRGGITTLQTGASAIKVVGDGALVSNLAGSKTITSGDGAFGILVVGNDAEILHAGEMTTGGSQAHGISVVGGRAVTSKFVTNLGNITTTGPTAHGINLTGNGLDALNAGSITVTGVEANGIYVQGDMTSVSNLLTGTITATFASWKASAVHLDSLPGTTLSFENSGTVTGANGGGVQGGAGIDKIVNSGVINGDVLLGGGSDVLTLQQGSQISGVSDGGISAGDDDELIIDTDRTLAISGDKFINFESFAKQGFGTAVLDNGTLEIDLDATIDNGALLLNPGSVFSAFGIDVTSGLFMDSSEIRVGSDVTVHPGAIFQGTGIVDEDLIYNLGGNVVVNGNVIVANSTGTLTVAGDFDLAGFLELEAYSLTDMDQLIIGGDFNITSGSIEVMLGFIPNPTDVLEFFAVSGITNILDGYNPFVGIAANGSVPLGTGFDVALGGQVFHGIVTSAVPIPPAALLFPSALVALGWLRRRQSRGFPGSARSQGEIQ